jgi:hypothetical protein
MFGVDCVIQPLALSAIITSWPVRQLCGMLALVHSECAWYEAGVISRKLV